jgi:hypothetical protein
MTELILYGEAARRLEGNTMRIRHSISRLFRALAAAAVLTLALAGVANAAVLAQSSQATTDKYIRWIVVVVVLWMVMGLTKGKK